MNRQSGSICRAYAGPAFVLAGLLVSLAAPGHCQDQPVGSARARALAASGRWIPTGNLNVARDGHTATLLSNGKVLIVGGANDNGAFPSSAELYDSATGTWSVTGRLNAAHAGPTATLLPDGRVLIVGGVYENGYILGDTSPYNAELYDPATGTWSATSPTTNRFDHTATLLKTGKVLIAGGGGTLGLRAAALYDPATETWSTTGSLHGEQRFGHQATLLQDGRVLVTGGALGPDLVVADNTAELYDPIAGTWKDASPLHTARYGHTATLLSDGRVLVAGGTSTTGQPCFPCLGLAWFPAKVAELFDPGTGEWSDTGSLNTDRSGTHTASLLSDGKVLVAGGYTNAALDSAELYDPSTSKWEYTSTLNTARSGHTATLLRDGKVLVAGGIGVGTDSYRPLNSTELYGDFAPGTIVPGFTGVWYDPTQVGHGIFIEVLSDNRLLAWWFSFNPAGTEQSWFGGVGTYSGNDPVIVPVYQATGGRWIPDFDPSQIVNSPWGTLTFTFTDCNHGRVDFNSIRGYGSGSMNLTRLTQPVGLSCP